MDSIYDEMYIRNTNWLLNNSIIFDPLLLTPLSDDRKCIALVAKDPVELLNINEISEISGPLSDRFMCPKIHSTFIVLRGWQNKEFEEEDWTQIKKIIQNNVVPYEIIFDRVIPVKTGLLLCGTPSLNINEIRDKIHAAGYETNALYKCDIAHTTILRWTHPLTSDEQSEWLEKIISLPRKPYAKINVTGFDIILASWSMHPDTTAILDTIDI
jgi:hypothetical protein